MTTDPKSASRPTDHAILEAALRAAIERADIAERELADCRAELEAFKHESGVTVKLRSAYNEGYVDGARDSRLATHAEPAPSAASGLAEELRRFANRVEELAFKMQAPNAYTPQFVQIAQEMRIAAFRSHQAPVGENKGENDA